MFYNVVNNASAVITSPHTIGDGILRINPVGIFGSGGFPLRVTCVRQSDSATVIYAIGSSGATSLNITGVLENTADINLAVNDICQADVTAGTFRDIHSAIISSSGTTVIGTSGAIPIYSSTGLTEDPSRFFYDKTNGLFGLGTNLPGAKAQINTGSASRKGLILKGFLSQSENLFEAQNSIGTVLTSMNPGGLFRIATSQINVSSLEFYDSTYAIGMDSNSISISYGVAGEFKIKTGGVISGTVRAKLDSNFNFGIGLGAANTEGTIHARGTSVATPTAIFDATTSQTADLTRWRNSVGITLASVDASGGITPGNLTSLPTASAGYRGKIYTVFGGAGVADHAYMCLKSSGDVYSWVQFG